MLAEKTDPRAYTVMCDSLRHPGQILARIAPPFACKNNFWTATDLDQVWKMDRKTAQDVLANLDYNSPRIVRYEKALAIIESQGPNAAAPEPEDSNAPGF